LPSIRPQTPGGVLVELDANAEFKQKAKRRAPRQLLERLEKDKKVSETKLTIEKKQKAAAERRRVSLLSFY
jgi:hypothetical protein